MRRFSWRAFILCSVAGLQTPSIAFACQDIRAIPPEVLSAVGQSSTASPMDGKTQMTGLWQIQWEQLNRASSDAAGGSCFLRLTSAPDGLSGSVEMPYVCSTARLQWTRWERADGILKVYPATSGGGPLVLAGNPQTEFKLDETFGVTGIVFHTRTITYCGGYVPPATGVVSPMDYLFSRLTPVPK